MLDTTVFDDIVSGDIDPAVVPLGCKLLAIVRPVATTQQDS